MGSPGAVRFHAALRASHGLCGLCDIHFLPVTQHECLTLTQWQAFNGFLNDIKDLLLFQLFRRAARQFRIFADFKRVEWIDFLVLVCAEQIAEGHDPGRAHFLPAEKVADGILQDALEQHRQFCRRPGGVILRQLEHRLLHDIERKVFVPYRKYRLLECPAFDFCQKIREFLVCGQWVSLF